MLISHMAQDKSRTIHTVPLSVCAFQMCRYSIYSHEEIFLWKNVSGSLNQADTEFYEK